MNVIRTASILVSCLVVTGCGGAPTPAPAPTPSATPEPPADPPPTEDKPKVDISALMDRELTGELPTHDVKAADGVWSLKAHSKDAPKLGKEGDIETLTLSLGTEAPIRCYVYRKPTDAGGSIAAAMQSDPNKEYKAISPINVVAAGDVPVMAARGVYLVDQDGEKAAGELKFAVASHHAWAISCYQDELGYEKSFTDIVQAMVKSISFKTDKPTSYVSLRIMRVGDQPIGFERVAYGPLPDKKHYIIHEAGAVAVPKDKQRYSFLDYITRQKVDKAGRLVGGNWVSALDGNLSIVATVKHIKGGKHVVQGKLGSKDVKAHFTTKNKKALAGLLLQGKELKARLKAGATVDYERFVPPSSIEKLTTMTAKVDAKDASKYTTTRKGQTKTRTLDANGQLKHAETTLPDGSHMVVEVVATSGKL